MSNEARRAPPVSPVCPIRSRSRSSLPLRCTSRLDQTTEPPVLPPPTSTAPPPRVTFLLASGREIRLLVSIPLCRPVSPGGSTPPMHSPSAGHVTSHRLCGTLSPRIGQLPASLTG